MGYNARNDEIRDNVTRMRREWEAQRNALATVRRFNATSQVGGRVPPKVGGRCAMPALQWVWPPAHHCVGATAVDLKTNVVCVL